MSKLFISDLHLDETRPDLTQALLNFLETHAEQADELYILGDFFEVWLGDDHESAFNQTIIDALAKLDTPLFIMHGNRDFLLGSKFCEQTGATLLPDPSTIDIDGETVLLMHGDSLCTNDAQYMQIRTMLRDESFQKDFLAKSLEERAAFAKAARTQSRERTRESASDIMDVTPSEVEIVMQTHHVSTLIHGHTHRPYVHELDEGKARRIVLGDWDQNLWYIEAAAGELELKSRPISPE